MAVKTAVDEFLVVQQNFSTDMQELSKRLKLIINHLPEKYYDPFFFKDGVKALKEFAEITERLCILSPVVDNQQMLNGDSLTIVANYLSGERFNEFMQEISRFVLLQEKVQHLVKLVEVDEEYILPLQGKINPSNHKDSFFSLAIKPVQQLTRIRLLFKEVLKQHSMSEKLQSTYKKAYEMSGDELEKANEAKRAYEGKHQQEIAYAAILDKKHDQIKKANNAMLARTRELLTELREEAKSTITGHSKRWKEMTQQRIHAFNEAINALDAIYLSQTTSKFADISQILNVLRENSAIKNFRGRGLHLHKETKIVRKVNKLLNDTLMELDNDLREKVAQTNQELVQITVKEPTKVKRFEKIMDKASSDFEQRAIGNNIAEKLHIIKTTKSLTSAQIATLYDWFVSNMQSHDFKVYLNHHAQAKKDFIEGINILTKQL